MTLTEFQTAVDGAKSGTNIVEVYFDFLAFMNEAIEKQYPLVIWDLDNLKGSWDLRSGTLKTVEIDIYLVNLVVPNTDHGENRLSVWDTMIADLIEYLNSVNDTNLISVKPDEINLELIPAGMLSMERELGVRFRIEVTLWC